MLKNKNKMTPRLEPRLFYYRETPVPLMCPPSLGPMPHSFSNKPVLHTGLVTSGNSGTHSVEEEAWLLRVSSDHMYTISKQVDLKIVKLKH